jgi:hypothetical protein
MPLAPCHGVRSALSLVCALLLLSLGVPEPMQPRPAYRLESRSSAASHLRELTAEQVALLEKLNRADAEHLGELPVVVLPESWEVDELQHSPLPLRYATAAASRKLIVVHLPGQVFGAYEAGWLVRWGPVSSGRAASPTPVGEFRLNWKSTGRTSTVNPDWFMRWYFNFGNEEGLAFHHYALPGYPASHGCIRLLERDAIWLYGWGEEWALASDGRVSLPGTPVSIVGPDDVSAPLPWRSLDWLATSIELR